jgi:hypothetical protein
MDRSVCLQRCRSNRTSDNPALMYDKILGGQRPPFIVWTIFWWMSFPLSVHLRPKLPAIKQYRNE